MYDRINLVSQFERLSKRSFFVTCLIALIMGSIKYASLISNLVANKGDITVARRNGLNLFLVIGQWHVLCSYYT